MIIKQCKYLFMAFVVVMFTACETSTDTKVVAKERAFQKIETFTERGETALSLQDYIDMGVVGVEIENLAEINEVVRNLTPDDVKTTEEIQALVNKLGVISPDTAPPVVATSADVPSNSTTQDATVSRADAKKVIPDTIVPPVVTPTVTEAPSNTTMQDSTVSRADVEKVIPDTAAPVFTSSNAASVNEKQISAITLAAIDDESAVTYSISGTDASDFSVDADTGEVAFDTAPDFETKNSYTFTATARDASSNATTQDITITVLSVNKVIVHNGTTYRTVTSPYTGKVWLDRNLGAKRVCTNSNDEACYGDYYQWGRNFDGHQKKTSGKTNVHATNVNNAGNDFITDDGTNGYDWVKEADVNGTIRQANWSKTDGSSVCPVGFRVPTVDELKAELFNAGSAQIQNNDDAFVSFLKLPSAGYRDSYTAALNDRGSWGNVWSSSATSSYAPNVGFDPSYADCYNKGSRAYGRAVRCLKK